VDNIYLTSRIRVCIVLVLGKQRVLQHNEITPITITKQEPTLPQKYGEIQSLQHVSIIAIPVFISMIIRSPTNFP
jgi:hypothetical protein